VQSCFASGAVWYLPGNSAIGGAHRGWPAIRDGVLAKLGPLFDAFWDHASSPGMKWLSECSAAAVRQALEAVAPELSGYPITVPGPAGKENPVFHSGSALQRPPHRSRGFTTSRDSLGYGARIHSASMGIALILPPNERVCWPVYIT